MEEFVGRFELFFWAWLLFTAIICGGLSGRLADLKGYDKTNWMLAGFFFGILGLIAAAGLPTNHDRTSDDEDYSTYEKATDPHDDSEVRDLIDKLAKGKQKTS